MDVDRTWKMWYCSSHRLTDIVTEKYQQEKEKVQVNNFIRLVIRKKMQIEKYTIKYSFQPKTVIISVLFNQFD